LEAIAKSTQLSQQELMALLNRFYEDDELTASSTTTTEKKSRRPPLKKWSDTPGPGAYFREYPVPGPRFKMQGRPEWMVPGASDWTAWTSSQRLLGGPEPTDYQYHDVSLTAFKATRYGLIDSSKCSFGRKNQAALDSLAANRNVCRPVKDYTLPDTMANNNVTLRSCESFRYGKAPPAPFPRLPEAGPGEGGGPVHIGGVGDGKVPGRGLGSKKDNPRWSLFPRGKGYGFRTPAWTPDTFSQNLITTYS
jgi:hypothetical protein